MQPFKREKKYYPACLDGGPALSTIEAMVPTRIIRVSGEQLVKRFNQDKKAMDLRCLIAERLCITPQQLSRIRKAVTFSEK
ncbi:MAG: hypothetical protein IJ559_07480 [Prevotella sp.]|nr:hypothetical protein [Prevotella sp.]